MNFVNNIVRNLEHLDQTASEMSRETDGDLKETIAKNIPIVTNKVKEITARGFSAATNADGDDKRRTHVDAVKRLETSEEIARALASVAREGDEEEEKTRTRNENETEENRKQTLARQTELLLPALRALEADVDALQTRANERKVREEAEAKKRMEAKQHEVQETMRLERLLERERNARLELERFEEERAMAMKNDQGECEKTTRECQLAKEERRKESDKAKREKESVEKELEEIERRIVEAEERLRVERSRKSSVSASTSAATEEENADSREKRHQLKRLVEEAKREVKLLDEQVYEQNHNNARYRKNSDDYRAEMQRRLRSLDEQLQFRRMKLAGLESQKADVETELERYKSESNAVLHHVSVLDEFNVHPTGEGGAGSGGERGEKGTQRRRNATGLGESGARRRSQNEDTIDDEDARKKNNISDRRTPRQKFDAFLSLVLRLLRDSPSVRGLFVILFTFVHVYVFVSSAKHALHNDPNHREGKEHH